MKQLAVVQITDIAAGGAGVGRLPDGRVVFVQRTAPGDQAEIHVRERKRHWARGSLHRLLESGPGRRPAPCPHYDRCGGCTLEHLAYPTQLVAKERIVREALRRIGRLSTAVGPVVPSPREFRYRNRVSFTLIRLSAGGVVAGFHQLERPDRVLDIDEACLLPEPVIGQVWNALRREWGENASRLPSGHRLRLTLRATAPGQVSLLADGGFAQGRPTELLERVPSLTAVWHQAEGDAGPRLVAGSAALTESWHDIPLELSGGVFLQVNRQAARLLESYVLERIGEPEGKRMVDAYCGVGLYARRLAGQGARVVGVEIDPAAVAEARRNAPEGVTFLEGRVDRLLAQLLPADLVILNPPRTGLPAAAVASLRGAPPGRILYVSCDPATLARDLQRLGPGCRIRSLRAFDLFPQTAHVETVVELECVTS